MADRGLFQGLEKRLPRRAAAIGEARALGSGACLLHDHRLARAVSDHARARLPGNAL